MNAAEYRRKICNLREFIDRQSYEIHALVKTRDALAKELDDRPEVTFLKALYLHADVQKAKAVADEAKAIIGANFSSAFDAVNDARESVRIARDKLDAMELEYFTSGAYLDENRYAKRTTSTKGVDASWAGNGGMWRSFYNWLMGRAPNHT